MKKPSKNSSPHYIHSMTYSFQERVVGTFVLLAMVALLGLLIATGKTKYLFEDYITIYGHMSKAQGVVPDSTIRISGIDGGYVSALDISEKNEIVVTMRIFERFQRLIRSDSVATLNKTSFFGTSGSIIEISAGSPDKPLLTDQARIDVRESYSLEDMASQTIAALDKVQVTVRELGTFIEKMHPEQFTDSVDNIGKITGNLRDITDQLAAGGGILGAALYDEEMKEDFKRSMHSLSTSIVVVEDRLEQLEPILANTGELSDTLKGTLEGFPQLVGELKNTVKQVNNMLSTLDNEVQQLPKLVGRMRVLLDESDKTLRAAQRVWPLSGAIQKPGEQQLVITPQPAHE